MASKTPKSFEDAVRKISNGPAFIAPDYNEDTFNFTALTAIWKGIPTLVSSESSVGKWLLMHSIPNSDKTTVNLTGDPEKDKEIWIKKINREILNEEARPKDWVQEMSEYLRKAENSDLWRLELSVLNPSDVDRCDPSVIFYHHYSFAHYHLLNCIRLFLSLFIRIVLYRSILMCHPLLTLHQLIVYLVFSQYFTFCER